jgi:hypothetical protein
MQTTKPLQTTMTTPKEPAMMQMTAGIRSNARRICSNRVVGRGFGDPKPYLRY